jgi:hypothetical protein
MSETENGAETAPKPVENPPNPAETPVPAKKPSALQEEAERGAQICWGYARLAQRFSRIARAVDDQLKVAELPGPLDAASKRPRELSILGAMRYLHDCHDKGPMPVLEAIAEQLETVLNVDCST